MKPVLVAALILSSAHGFLWTSKVDLKSVIHKLMHAAEEQAPHARKKLVLQAITGLGQRIKNLKEVDTAKQKEAKSYDELVEYLSENCRNKKLKELEEWADFHSVYHLAKETRKLREACRQLDIYSKRTMLNERVHEARMLIKRIEERGAGCLAYKSIIRLVEVGFSIDTVFKDTRWRKFWQDNVNEDEIKQLLEKIANLLNDFALEFSFNCPNINSKNFVRNVINFKKKWYRKMAFKTLE